MDSEALGPAPEISLCDLPTEAFVHIFRGFHIDEKRNVALVSKAMLSVIRSMWRKVRVNIYGEDLVPGGLGQFSGVRTIVWKDSKTFYKTKSRDADWEIEEFPHAMSPSAYEDPYPLMELPRPEAMARLCTLAPGHLHRHCWHHPRQPAP